MNTQLLLLRGVALFVLASFQFNAFGQDAIAEFPYFQNFEDGEGDWFSGGENNSWELNTPQGFTINFANSGEFAWATNPFGGYNNNEQSFVESPQFDFSGLASPIIEAKIWRSSESGSDGTIFQYSLDDGTSWITVGSLGDVENWYNNSSIFALEIS